MSGLDGCSLANIYVRTCCQAVFEDVVHDPDTIRKIFVCDSASTLEGTVSVADEFSDSFTTYFCFNVFGIWPWASFRLDIQICFTCANNMRVTHSGLNDQIQTLKTCLVWERCVRLLMCLKDSSF